MSHRKKYHTKNKTQCGLWIGQLDLVMEPVRDYNAPPDRVTCPACKHPTR